jgi:hypothetical protein
MITTVPGGPLLPRRGCVVAELSEADAWLPNPPTRLGITSAQPRISRASLVMMITL